MRCTSRARSPASTTSILPALCTPFTWLPARASSGGSKLFIVTMPGASADSTSAPASARVRRRAVISTSGSSGISARVRTGTLAEVRLLAFSDVHRNGRQARKLADRAGEVDAVIAAGDFASMHRGLASVIDMLVVIETPTVLVPGNNETDEALRAACEGWKAATVLHGEGTEIDGVPFFGLGAGVPETPWDWSFDLSEEEAEAKLAGCPAGAV